MNEDSVNVVNKSATYAVSSAVGSVIGLQFSAPQGPVLQQVCSLSQSEFTLHPDTTNALAQKSGSKGVSGGQLMGDESD